MAAVTQRRTTVSVTWCGVVLTETNCTFSFNLSENPFALLYIWGRSAFSAEHLSYRTLSRILMLMVKKKKKSCLIPRTTPAGMIFGPW